MLVNSGICGHYSVHREIIILDIHVFFAPCPHYTLAHVCSQNDRKRIKIQSTLWLVGLVLKLLRKSVPLPPCLND